MPTSKKRALTETGLSYQGQSQPQDPPSHRKLKSRRLHRDLEQHKHFRKTGKLQPRRDHQTSDGSPTPANSSQPPPHSNGSLFESASNIGINGGHFSADSSTNHSNTTLTINFLHSPPAATGFAKSFLAASPPVESESAQRERHEIVDSSRTTRQSFNATSPFSHTTGSQDNPEQHLEVKFGSGRDRSAKVEQRNNPDSCALDNYNQNINFCSGIGASRHAADELTGQLAYQPDNLYSVEDSRDIYYRHLSVKGHGYPLWLPEPNYHLPTEYQRKGISVGDVGMLTTEGGFDYLFNVLLPSDHPFNAGRVPPDFIPLSPALDPVDIRSQSVFRTDSFLASAGIERRSRPFNEPGTNFHVSAPRGAILITPDGATSEDLSNLSLLRRYTSDNIESWYRYVNGPRGREVANGDLRLIIGCHKTTAWGMAAFLQPFHGESIARHLYFKPSRPNEGTNYIKTYEWEIYSGTATDTRSGPSMHEVEALSAGDENQGHFKNQCIFVRTLNPTLSDTVWNAAMDGIQLETLSTDSNGEGSNKDGSTGQALRGNKAQPGEKRLLSADPGKNHPNQYALTAIPTYLSTHPSKLLNERILQRNYNLRMVMTDDTDWSCAFAEDETAMPDLSDLAERVLASSTLTEEAGDFVHLERRDKPSSAQQPVQGGELTQVNPSLGGRSGSAAVGGTVCQGSMGQEASAGPDSLNASRITPPYKEWRTRVSRSRLVPRISIRRCRSCGTSESISDLRMLCDACRWNQNQAKLAQVQEQVAEDGMQTRVDGLQMEGDRRVGMGAKQLSTEATDNENRVPS